MKALLISILVMACCLPTHAEEDMSALAAVKHARLQLEMRNVLSVCFDNQDAKSHKYAPGFEKCERLVTHIRDVLDYENALAAENLRRNNIEAVESLSQEMGLSSP